MSDMNQKIQSLEEEEKSLLKKIADNPKEILLLIRKLFGLLESKIDRMSQVAKSQGSKVVTTKSTDGAKHKAEEREAQPDVKKEIEKINSILEAPVSTSQKNQTQQFQEPTKEELKPQPKPRISKPEASKSSFDEGDLV